MSGKEAEKKRKEKELKRATMWSMYAYIRTRMLHACCATALFVETN